MGMEALAGGLLFLIYYFITFSVFIIWSIVGNIFMFGVEFRNKSASKLDSFFMLIPFYPFISIIIKKRKYYKNSFMSIVWIISSLFTFIDLLVWIIYILAGNIVFSPIMFIAVLLNIIGEDAILNMYLIVPFFIIYIIFTIVLNLRLTKKVI